MANSKQILVVDDHFEMLEFLRSMLELSNEDYQVLGVPSAEEGLLELHRRPFDLLITDVRLPGMSGFDLVRKANDLREGLPVLMITAYASAQGRQEAEQLGVIRYFEKPLDTDALLAAVQAILYAQPEPPRPPDTAPLTTASRTTASQTTAPKGTEDAVPAEGEPAAAAGGEPAATQIEGKRGARAGRDEAESIAITRRLQVLLTDTGAVQALIAGSEGRILYRAGSGEQPMERLTRLLSRSLADSFELAAELQSAEPFTIQYQAGERVDLYTANIGRHYFLILLFDARARRGRIGTVWVFAQRAIKEMREMLPQPAAIEGEAGRLAETGPGEREVALVADGPAVVEADPDRKQDDSAGAEGDSAKPEGGSAAADDVTASGREAGADALFDLWDGSDNMQGVDLDAFWDEATTDAGSGVGRGLTFEEAVQRGLLPPDLNK